MLSVAAVVLLLSWIVALVFSFTLGGWIHLLPALAVPLLIARYTRAEPEAAEYSKWKLAHARRQDRSRP